MPPPTAQQPASGLPPEQTTFVGRAAELERLSGLLETARLVTVTGTGGVGKTRLALRAAEAAAGSGAFPDGVRFVELSGLRDPELLANTVAAVLDLPENDAWSRLEQVLGYLRDQRLLLILDTCERLVEACALFAEAVLDRTGHVTVLATSREPLFVAGENECPLAPLTEGGDADAVELFTQRAAAAAPGFDAAAVGRAGIARLCRHLDGIPLAIELAAVQLRSVSFGELARRAELRFLDLPGDPGATGRHQSLRDAIGWSHELCTSEERALWERLSVFAAPATAEAAAQVCAGSGLSRVAVRSALIGLADKSVVTRTGDGVSRYRMLDTVREYGAGRLADTGTGLQVRARHLRRYLALADELSEHPEQRQVSKYTTLRAEHADIRAALEHAASLPGSAGTVHPSIQLPVQLDWYWVISARFGEGRYWLTRGLDRVPEPGPERARALAVRAYMTIYLNDFESALADASEAVAIADDLGDRRLRAHALAHLAAVLLTSDRLEETRQAAEESERLLELSGGQGGIRLLLMVVKSYQSLLTGNIEDCLRHCEQSLRLIPADSGERWCSGYLNTLAGWSLAMLGRPDAGSRLLRLGLAMKQELGDIPGMIQCLGGAALVAGVQQRHERTAWLIGATAPQWDKLGGAYAGVDQLRMLTDQVAQETRAALGDDRYDELARDGASLPVGQVIDLAVRDSDQLPALPAGNR
jgi:non-specific serine/threonine protein kinase